DTAEPLRQPLPGPAAATQARITANPNPVPVGGGRGRTTIACNTGDMSIAQVYVSRGKGREELLGQGAQGSFDVMWIEAGSTYEFRLYAGREHMQVLARVIVQGVRAER